MAYIVKDADESSRLMSTGTAAFKSFLTSNEDPNIMAPPAHSFSFVKRNLMSEIHRYNNHPNSGHPNIGNIRIPDFLKSSF